MSYYGTKNEDILQGCKSPYAYSRAIRVDKSDEKDGAGIPIPNEPVTLDEAKKWLRIDLSETTFNDQITEGIIAARQQCEEYLNVSLIRRTITASLQLSPGGIQLPYAPVIGELTSVTDIDGNAIDTGTYKLNDALFVTNSNYDVVVTYEAGYENCPAWGKTGIKRLLAWDWENRGDTGEARNIGKITGLRPYRRVY